VGRPQGMLIASGGTGWPKKRMPVAERQQEADPESAVSSDGRVGITGRDTAPGIYRGGTRCRVLTWAG
jgi:hypothetical protein